MLHAIWLGEITVRHGQVVSTHNGAVLGTLTISAISAVPEPSVIFLLDTGLLALLGFAKEQVFLE
jgi:hypothetical protein